jgi:Transposase, Mutator family
LRGVKLVISDAHEGLKAAIRRVFGAGWQRCRVHWMRNALAYVPKTQQSMVAAALRQAFLQPDRTQASVMLRHFADPFRQKWPKLGALIDSETEVLSYLDFPEPHRSKLHSTDEIDKPFSAGSLTSVGTRSCSREGSCRPFLSVEGTMAKRAVGMRLCQRREPPKAVAAGQRLQSRIPTATITRDARGGCFVQSQAAVPALPTSVRNLAACYDMVLLHGRPRGEEQG